MKNFQLQLPVRFEHVDLAGVIFYPRAFEMISTVVEAWLEEVLGYSYRQYHQFEHRAIPLVDIQCRFFNPTFLSDKLQFGLGVTRLGKRSVSINIQASCEGEQRFEADMTVVHGVRTETGFASADIPATMAAAIKNYLRDAPPG